MGGGALSGVLIDIFGGVSRLNLELLQAHFRIKYVVFMPFSYPSG